MIGHSIAWQQAYRGDSRMPLCVCVCGHFLTLTFNTSKNQWSLLINSDWLLECSKWPEGSVNDVRSPRVVICFNTGLPTFRTAADLIVIRDDWRWIRDPERWFIRVTVL